MIYQQSGTWSDRQKKVKLGGSLKWPIKFSIDNLQRLTATVFALYTLKHLNCAVIVIIKFARCENSNGKSTNEKNPC